MQVIRQSEIRERCFGVVTQRDANVEDPQLSDLFTVGTIVEVSQIVELPRVSSLPSFVVVSASVSSI